MNQRDFSQIKRSLGAADERVNGLIDQLRTAGLDVQAYEAWRDACTNGSARTELRSYLEAGGTVEVGEEVVEGIEQVFDDIGGLEEHLKAVNRFRQQLEEAEAKHTAAGANLTARTLQVARGVPASTLHGSYIEYALDPGYCQRKSQAALTRARQFLSAGNVVEGYKALTEGRQFATRQYFLGRLLERSVLVPATV